MRRRIAIVGTGTEVGKTHLGVALISALTTSGVEAAGLKPVESGVGSGVSDTERLGQTGMFHVKHPPPYALKTPVSPHLAARLEGVTIELDRIVAWVDACAAAWTIVETAGGLLSPLGPAFTNLHLVRALWPDALVLVAVDRLGVLHDLAACQVALRSLAPELPEPLVALQCPAQADASTGTNGAEIVGLGIASRLVVIPRGEPGSPEVRAAVTGLVGLLGGG
jgi:dethiobiotin synthetase